MTSLPTRNVLASTLGIVNLKIVEFFGLGYSTVHVSVVDGGWEVTAIQ